MCGVHAVGRANGWVISGAYGGFSNVWGAHVMPLSAAMFQEWPPFAAEDDDSRCSVSRSHSLRCIRGPRLCSGHTGAIGSVCSPSGSPSGTLGSPSSLIVAYPAVSA